MLQVCLSCFSNANAEVSQNLLDPNGWDGATYGPDPGGCCASISGSGALYDTNTGYILFSYGTDIVSQTIGINTALQAQGIQVDGFQYHWHYELVSNSGRGGDQLLFTVTVKDSAGNEVETYTYDYSNSAYDVDIHAAGTEYFTSPYFDPQSIQLKIQGRDGGYWAGYYGPEIHYTDLRLIYSVDPCAADPLYDPSCSGYAEAYAQYQYDQACSADPLYDSGCPNYATAYYNQQCSINPLYDSGCYGYADAYFAQQCTLDGLYSESCPNYAEAYFNQQCELDVFYDTQCEGYAEAVVEKYVTNETESTQETVSATPQTVTTVTSAEDITEVSVTGDSTIDSILRDTADVSTTVNIVEVATVASDTVEEQTTTRDETETTTEADSAGEVEELNEETLSESSGDVEESVDSDRNEESSDTEQSSEGSSESDSEGDSESSEQDSKSDKKKKLVAKRAKSLAEKMSDAATLEAQQAVQAQVLALINYVPNFATYGGTINGGYYADANGYPDTQVPESRRGLRNGLAQQILHNQMVDMQYENLTD